MTYFFTVVQADRSIILETEMAQMLVDLQTAHEIFARLARELVLREDQFIQLSVFCDCICKYLSGLVT